MPDALRPSAGSPLAPNDVDGQGIATGCQVIVLSVATCAHGLPSEDQDRLNAIVGQVRHVARLDQFGFVWLSFSPDERSDDFCLLPSEVRVTLAPEAQR